MSGSRRSRGAALSVSVIVAAVLVLGWAPNGNPVRAAGCQDLSLCVTLNFNLPGDGTGTIQTMDPTFTTPDGLINCLRQGGLYTGTCSQQYQKAAIRSAVDVYVAFRPLSDSELCNAPNSCASNSVGFHYALTTNMTVTSPYFVLTSPQLLAVTKIGTGTGSVTSSPIGINCGAKCGADFTSGTPVTLTADPASGSTFTGWAGACSGVSTNCLVIMSSGQTVTAVFTSSTPTATPHATPTPAPTTKPTASPKASQAASSKAPSSGGPSASQPNAGASPTDGAPGPTVTVPPTGFSPAPSDQASSTVAPGSGPASGAGGDNIGIILAILLAGLFVAAALGWVGYSLQKARKT